MILLPETIALTMKNQALYNKMMLGGLTIGDLQKFMKVCARKRPWGECSQIAISVSKSPSPHYKIVAFFRRKNKRLDFWMLWRGDKTLADNKGPNAPWRRCKHMRPPDLSIKVSQTVKVRGDTVQIIVNDEILYRDLPFSQSWQPENAKIFIKLERAPFPETTEDAA